MRPLKKKGNTMTESQRNAMIEMHKKMERAYRSVGNYKDANAAMRLRFKLENFVDEMNGYIMNEDLKLMGE